MKVFTAIVDLSCCSLQSLLNDISIVTDVFALPLLEPMTPARLHRIATIAMSCLYAAMTAATATAIVGVATGTQMKGVGASKDDEIDGYAAGIVEKAVSAGAFKTIISLFPHLSLVGIIVVDCSRRCCFLYESSPLVSVFTCPVYFYVCHFILLVQVVHLGDSGSSPLFLFPWTWYFSWRRISCILWQC